MFFFSIDAEVAVDRIGQFVNDEEDAKCNAVMKLKIFDGKEHLCLYSTKEIQPYEEITYNYGDQENLWWRNKVSI